MLYNLKCINTCVNFGIDTRRLDNAYMKHIFQTSKAGGASAVTSALFLMSMLSDEQLEGMDAGFDKMPAQAAQLYTLLAKGKVSIPELEDILEIRVRNIGLGGNKFEVEDFPMLAMIQKVIVVQETTE